MERRSFIKKASILSLATLPINKVVGAKAKKNKNTSTSDIIDERKLWADLLYKIAKPVLSNMSKGELRKNMEMKVSPIWDNRDKDVGYLEAFGRLTAGLSFWLNLPDDDTSEGQQRKELKSYTLQSIAHAVNPRSPDYLAWNSGSQPLVDAAYLAEAFIRSPKALWEPLDEKTKQGVIREMKGLRHVRPAYNNWLLFAAMTEAFLLSVGEECEPFRIDIAIRKINEWYVGDGWYADGPKFGMDYYNGYVIHSMLLDVAEIYIKQKKMMQVSIYDDILKRMQRYSQFLERFISPEGTYPPFGRSITYRLGAFQPLVHLAYKEKLPEGISPAQVRCALTAVIRKMFFMEGTFDENNFLNLGFVGLQPNLADYYTNTGSLYITSLGFLPLGLPPTHEFWTAPPADWTAKKAWEGKVFPKDYAVNY